MEEEGTGSAGAFGNTVVPGVAPDGPWPEEAAARSLGMSAVFAAGAGVTGFGFGPVRDGHPLAGLGCRSMRGSPRLVPDQPAITGRRPTPEQVITLPATDLIDGSRALYCVRPGGLISRGGVLGVNGLM